MARRGAKLLYAYCEATVPKIQLIVRRAYGAAYVVMGSKSLGADLAYAWPGAELAVVGPESAVDLLYSSELAGAPPERRRELVDAYREANANPYLAAEHGYIDDVIEPASTRRVLHQALEMLASKRQEAPRASTATYRCEQSVNEKPTAGTGLRVRLRSSDLASAPSPAELEAITLAVRQALGAKAPVPASELSSEQTVWRLELVGGPAEFSPACGRPVEKGRIELGTTVARTSKNPPLCQPTHDAGLQTVAPEYAKGLFGLVGAHADHHPQSHVEGPSHLGVVRAAGRLDLSEYARYGPAPGHQDGVKVGRQRPRQVARQPSAGYMGDGADVALADQGQHRRGVDKRRPQQLVCQCVAGGGPGFVVEARPARPSRAARTEGIAVAAQTLGMDAHEHVSRAGRVGPPGPSRRSFPTTPTANPARSISPTGSCPGCSASSPPRMAQPAWRHPSATPDMMTATASGSRCPHNW